MGLFFKREPVVVDWKAGCEKGKEREVVDWSLKGG